MIDFSRLDSERVRSGLNRHRNSPILRNRLAAIKALSILKDTSVVADIDDVLKETRAANSRATFLAIHALGKLECDESRDRLTALISDDQLEDQVRVAAAEEMLKNGPISPAFDYLASVAATCRGIEAPTAARAIRTIDHRQGTRLMLAILENGDDYAKQITVLFVSSEMGQPDAKFNSSGLRLAHDYLQSLMSE
jgi:HEAT repeat protein